MGTYTEKEIRHGYFVAGWLSAMLKKGDTVTIIKCPGTKRWFTFDYWEGVWMVSKSGIADNHPLNVVAINGKPIVLPSA